MNTQKQFKIPPMPQEFRLRKVMPEDDYVDYIHERAQPTKRPPGLWQLGGLLALLVTAFLFAGPLLRLADDTAAVVDAGILSLLLLTAIGVLTFHLLARGLVLPLFRSAYRLSGGIFSEFSNELTPWQYACIYLVCYASLFWGAVALLLAVM